MANTHNTLTELFTNIADAIKEKKNTTEIIIADTFPDEIKNLKTGFDYINQDVTIIPNEAFYSCEDIRSVDCYNLTSIGVNAFKDCKNLKVVILYNGVESVGENAFKGCDCIIYCEAMSKPDTWHDNWNPDNCEVVWDFSLVKTWNISATKNDNVIAKLYNDIYNEGHYSLIISGNGNMKKYYDMPDTPNCDIPWENYCKKITKIILDTGVANIGDYAFGNCISCTSITIPDSVTSIGKWTFFKCSLTSINYMGTVAQWNAIIFGSGWNSNTSNYTVHCTNGDIAKDGTITYH